MPPVAAFDRSELPHISGRTVPEHLLYCIQHYCPRAALGELQDLYTDIAEEYMQKLNAGELDIDAFEPAEGLKELLLMLKENGIKIGIVTSGLYYKAWPELKQAMDKLGLGEPISPVLADIVRWNDGSCWENDRWGTKYLFCSISRSSNNTF